ncbi:MAG: amidohydrolase family protein [Pseudomonadota bacterium]
MLVDSINKRLIQKDIGIKNGKIDEIGSSLGAAKETVIADGKYISPGFIDIHMHEEDLALTKGKDLDISLALLRNGVTTAVGGNCGSNRNDFKEFIRYIQAGNYPINFMTYIGHNYLRERAGNSDPYARSTKFQIEKMRGMAEEAIDFGGIGLSYGLEYCPGIDEAEAIGVAEGLYERDDVLMSFHARYDSQKALAAISEIHNIAKAVKAPIQISHLSSLCAYGNMDEALRRIEKISEEGIDVMCDAYPYGAFSCKIGSTVFDEGCFDNWGKSYDSVMLAEEPYKGVFCNRELFYEVREKYPRMYVVAMMMNEEEIKTALRHPLVFACSDGAYNNHQGHPRGSGSFSRILGRYSLRENVLDMFDAIHKMTVMPAERLRLSHRKGKLAEGFDADLVIFDPNTVMDSATFEKPQTPPAGIDYVFVNGHMAVANGVTAKTNGGEFVPRQ